MRTLWRGESVRRERGERERGERREERKKVRRVRRVRELQCHFFSWILSHLSFIRQVVSAKPWFEQLTRTFDVYSLETLKEGKADFQKTLTFWEKSLEREEKLSLFTAVCGTYTST